MNATSRRAALGVQVDVPEQGGDVVRDAPGGRRRPGGPGRAPAGSEPAPRKNRPAAPSGVQLPMATRPPGRQTRSSSPAVARWSGANMAPTVDSTTSKWSSGKGRSWASANSQVRASPRARAARSPTASSCGQMSVAMTSAPVAAAGRAALPVPAPTSSTRWPARTPAAATTARPISEIKAAIRSYSPMAQNSAGCAHADQLLTRARRAKFENWTSRSRPGRGSFPTVDGYGQFCPIALGAEVFAERWTPIILRNLMVGCERFGEILAGAPGLPRSVLDPAAPAGARRGGAAHGARGAPRYRLTACGTELAQVCLALGAWGARWREVRPEHRDPYLAVWTLSTLVEATRCPGPGWWSASTCASTRCRTGSGWLSGPASVRSACTTRASATTPWWPATSRRSSRGTAAA